MIQEFINKRTEIEKHINNRRLSEAIDAINEIAKAHSRKGVLSNLRDIRTNYNFVLKSVADGVSDPQRNDVINRIVNDLFRQIDIIERYLRYANDNTLYFSVFRFESSRPAETVADLLLKYEDLLNYPELGADPLKELEKRIFNRIWVTYPLMHSNFIQTENTLLSDKIPADFKKLLVSSLLLGALRFYDENRLILLLKTYMHHCADYSSPLAAAALTALVMVLCAYPNRPVSTKLSLLIERARTMPGWNSDLAAVVMELAKTRDTDRINKKMTDELIPGLMKLRPDIARKHLNISEIRDIADLEENPEWVEMLRESGIADKMKEMTEIQEEGGDVFMSTFAHLKSFPFFSEFANWFMPFSTENSDLKIKSGDELSVRIAQSLAESPFLCDSDKYSFFFSLGQIPDSQREMMLSQFKMQSQNSSEIISTALNSSAETRKNAVNKYIQDLFRFFRLYQRKREFFNPFEKRFNPFASKEMTSWFVDMEIPGTVAEFYFSHKYYPEALEMFRALETHSLPSATLYQKIGFCLQKEGEIENALEYYERAELLDGSSLWTLKRIASCLSLLGRYRQALDYYRRIDSLEPDNPATTADIANTLIELGMFNDALPLLHKALYLTPGSKRLTMALGRTLMLTGDLKGAAKTYGKLIGGKATATDYLNMGHVSLARKQVAEAVDYYRMAAANSTVEETAERLFHDSHLLEQIGADVSLLPLIADALDINATE